MNKIERLNATISGKSVDRVAVAAWRHQPVDDQDAESFASATVAFQSEFDFDFVKVTPAASYCVRHWGADDIWRGHPHGTREYGGRVITSVADWSGLKTADPNRGQMGQVLEALRMIGAALEDDTPFIQTIFSPMTQARNLAGPEVLFAHMRTEPATMHDALQMITDQTVGFVEAAIDTGISGVFYALQGAVHTEMSEGEYMEFGAPYDLQILAAAKQLWLNTIHLHGREVMFSVACEYPGAILNWHDRESRHSLEAGLERWSGAVCGGISQEETLMAGNPRMIRDEAMDAISVTGGGRRLVLGTGCVAPIVTPYGNLKALREAVDGNAR